MPATIRAILGPLCILIALCAATIVCVSRRWLTPDIHSSADLGDSASVDDQQHLHMALALDAMPGDLAAAGQQRCMQQIDRQRQHIHAHLPASRAQSCVWYTVALCISALLIHILWPLLLGTVIPRYIEPWADHPPYSLTQITWQEKPQRVRSGFPARFTVRVQGHHADSLTLHTSTDDGRNIGKRLTENQLQSIPMYPMGAGEWSARISTVNAAQRVWVSGAGTRTHYHYLGIDPVPVPQLCTLTVMQPAYTGIADEQYALHFAGTGTEKSNAGAQGNKATRIVRILPTGSLDLELHANRPLEAVYVQRVDDENNKKSTDHLQEHAQEHSQNPSAHGTRFPVLDNHVLMKHPRAGLYRIVFAGRDGTHSQAYDLVHVQHDTDNAPQLYIENPAQDAYATPGMKIAMHIRASDDYGLRGIERIGEYNGLAAPNIFERMSGRSGAWSGSLDIAGLGVAPGDMLRIGALAQDTYPRQVKNGIRGQFSPAAWRRISIISEESYNAYLRKRLGPDVLQRKYGALIRELQKIQQEAGALAEEYAAAQKAGQDAAAAMKIVAERMQKLLARTRVLDAKIAALYREKPLYAIEPELQKTMQRLNNELQEALEAGDIEALAQAAQAAPAEQLLKDLQRMAISARVDSLVRRLEKIIDAAQQTSGRIANYAEHRRLSDAERVLLREYGENEKEIAEAIKKWQELAQALAEKMDEHDIPSARLRQLNRALAETTAEDLCYRSARSCQAGEGVEAYRLASDAARRLLALLPQCQKTRNNNAGSCSGIGWCAGSKLAQALGQLGMGAGFGSGGSGSAGLGLSLGYGGDDHGQSMPSDSMDLYGPEDFSEATEQDTTGKDGIDNLATSGTRVSGQRAARYQQRVRKSTAEVRHHLGEREQKQIDHYFRVLGGEK